MARPSSLVASLIRSLAVSAAFGLVACASVPCPPGTERSAEGRCLTSRDDPAPGDPGDDAGVTEAPPPVPPPVEHALSIVARETALRVRVGEAIVLVVEVERSPGLLGAVQLDLEGLPPGVYAEAGYVVGDATEGVVTVRADGAAVAGYASDLDLCATVSGAPGLSACAPLSLLVTGHPGELDLSFGAAGVTVTQPFDGTADEVTGIAPTAAGGFAIAGNGFDGTVAASFVTAYRPDGTTDPDFAAAGTRRFQHPAVDSTAVHSVLATAGGLLLGLREDFALRVVRLDPAGAMDPAFGAGSGAARRPTAGGGLRLFAFADGFMLGGAADLERYDAGGVLVPGFGDGGVIRGTVPVGSSLAAMPDGGLVFGWRDGTGGFSFERYDPAGGRVASFGGTGRVSVRPSTDIGQVAAVVLGPDGGVYAVLSVPATPVAGPASGVRVVRLTAAGAFDRAFGVDGVATVTPVVGHTLEAAGAVVAAGRVLLWGERRDAADGSTSGYLAALDLDGHAIEAFGRGGFVDLGARVTPVAALVTADGDRLVAVGNRRARTGAGALRDIVTTRLWL